MDRNDHVLIIRNNMQIMQVAFLVKKTEILVVLIKLNEAINKTKSNFEFTLEIFGNLKIDKTLRISCNLKLNLQFGFLVHAALCGLSQRYSDLNTLQKTNETQIILKAAENGDFFSGL